MRMRVRTVLLVAAAAAISWVVAQPGKPPDYLPSELRAEVERLKKEAAEPAPDPGALGQRLRTLWQWSNAYALTGGPVPPDFPALVAQASRVQRPARGNQAVALNEMIARYTREFAIKDENPGALGTVALSQPGPFAAGAAITIDETYTAGEMPMQPGGGIAIGLNLFAARSLQSNDPSAPGYVSLACTNPAAKFEAAEPWGEWTSFITRGTIQFRLKQGTLRRGDKVTLTFHRMPLQRWSNDRVQLPLFVDLEGKGWLLTPRWPSFEVTGAAEVRHVRAVAPSVVGVGEPFELGVRSEDASYNLSSGVCPAYSVRLSGAELARTGTSCLATVGNLKALRAGIYRYEVRSADGSLSTLSNPVWARERPETRVYWGDTHGHSGFAEGQGSPDGYFRFGRDVARLDFLTLSEHDLWMDDGEWKALQETTTRYDAPGKFTAILGFEWTATNRLGGHHNVFFRTVAGRTRVPVQEFGQLDEMYKELDSRYKDDDVLVIPHAHQAGDWTRSNPGKERVVEMTSGHGTFEFFGNRYLENGWEVGFIGASDNHVGHPGYLGIQQQSGLGAVIARENRAESIFRALRARSVYATTGERIILDASLNGSGMGQRLPSSTERRITARAMGTAPIDSVDLVKNGKALYQRRYLQGAKVEPRSWVQLRFHSDTEVFSRANPRGPRAWRGSFAVEGARVSRIVTPGIVEPVAERFARDGQGARFAFQTRGRPRAYLIELDGASAGTRITVKLAASKEIAGSPGARDRDLAAMPAADLVFTLAELEQGPGRRELRVVRNVDSVEAQLLTAARSFDAEFEYTDRDAPRDGDYYYVRVVQADGAMAWSSPFWVGPRRTK